MNVLLLGPYRKELVVFMSSFGDKVIINEDRLASDSDCLRNTDFIVSYGYRHILKENILNRFQNKAINLHISLLPWNKGADPNLWSFLEDTPKGITIHFLDKGIDTGNILAQQEVEYVQEDTLRTSYERLSSNMVDLFKNAWPSIRVEKQKSLPQSGEGSCHSLRDRSAFEYLLTKGWDTPVVDLIGKANRVTTDEL